VATEEDSLERLVMQGREHEAWVKWAAMLREVGLDLNSVDVVTFEPVRVALCKWALAYAEGHHAGVFTTLVES
jgi:hypothetical protein